MRSSTAVLITLIATLSSTAPVLSAPISVSIPNFESKLQRLGFPLHAGRIGILAPQPPISLSQTFNKLPVNLPNANQQQRRDVEDFFQLVARALEDDESGAFSFGKLKDLGGVAGDLFSIGSNIHDFFKGPAPAPAPAPAAGAVPPPQRRDVDDLLELVARASSDDQDASGALNLLSFFGKFIRREDVEEFFARDDIVELMARDDLDESGAFSLGKLFSGIGHLIFGGGSSQPAPAPAPAQAAPQRREFDDFVQLVARASSDNQDASGALNLLSLLGHFIRREDVEELFAREDVIADLMARQDIDESGAFSFGSLVSGLAHAFFKREGSQPLEARELLELLARADLDEDESGAFGLSGIVNGIKGIFNNADKLKSIGNTVSLVNDISGIASNVKQALTPSPPPAPAPPAAAPAAPRSLNELD